MSNKAAERLLDEIGKLSLRGEGDPLDWTAQHRLWWEQKVDAALVLERKATVERIRAAVLAHWDAQHPDLEHQTEQWAADLWAERNDLEGIILDAEEAR